MFLDRKRKCPADALFDVPHKGTPMSAREIRKKFPEFAAEMDGCSEDRCLAYFWKRNKESGVYEFVDTDAEEELAEIWNVELYDEEKEIEKERLERRALTDDEIRTFKEDLLDTSRELKQFMKTGDAEPHESTFENGRSPGTAENQPKEQDEHLLSIQG